MGTKLADNQGDLTPMQRLFLLYAIPELMAMQMQDKEQAETNQLKEKVRERHGC